MNLKQIALSLISSIIAGNVMAQAAQEMNKSPGIPSDASTPLSETQGQMQNLPPSGGGSGMTIVDEGGSLKALQSPQGPGVSEAQPLQPVPQEGQSQPMPPSTQMPQQTETQPMPPPQMPPQGQPQMPQGAPQPLSPLQMPPQGQPQMPSPMPNQSTMPTPSPGESVPSQKTLPDQSPKKINPSLAPLPTPQTPGQQDMGGLQPPMMSPPISPQAPVAKPPAIQNNSNIPGTIQGGAAP